MPYHVGQEVVWVGPDLSQDINYRKLGFEAPKRKTVYVISDVWELPTIGFSYQLGGLHLNALSPCGHMRAEAWFEQEYLRPVEKRKTDISVFERLLVPGAKILVEA